MATDRDRRISELYSLRNASKHHSSMTALCDRLGSIAKVERCNYACFEAARLFGSMSNEEIIQKMKAKHGEDVEKTVTELMIEWGADSESFGKNAGGHTGQLPFDAFLDKLK